MRAPDILYAAEEADHDAEIESINDEAFGPGRFARAAYKIREGGPHERGLSFVAMAGRTVVGSVRLTRIAAGEGRALLLGRWPSAPPTRMPASAAGWSPWRSRRHGI